MVTNVTSLTGNGLKDWLLQRVTAVYLAVYTVFFLCFLLCHPDLNYHEWTALFQSVWFQMASLIGLLAFLIHAWIGIWTVTTDYIHCKVIRLSVQGLVALFLLAQLIWGFMMFWGR